MRKKIAKIIGHNIESAMVGELLELLHPPMEDTCSECEGWGYDRTAMDKATCERCDGIGKVPSRLALLLEQITPPCSNSDCHMGRVSLNEMRWGISSMDCPKCKGTGLGEPDWDRIEVMK